MTLLDQLQNAERLAEAQRRARPGSSEFTALRILKLQTCLAILSVVGSGAHRGDRFRGCVTCDALALALPLRRRIAMLAC